MMDRDAHLPLPTFEIEHLGQNLCRIEEIFKDKQNFAIRIANDSQLSESATRVLAEFDGLAVTRSTWKAVADAWRVRDLICCIGMADEAAYVAKVLKESAALVVVFEAPS